MAKGGKKAGGNRNRVWEGPAGQQVGKRTGRANDVSAGSRRRQPTPGEAERALRRGCAWPASVTGLGRQNTSTNLFLLYPIK